jgi:hypothetical protein
MNKLNKQNKMKVIIVAALISSLFLSCGVFLQNQGIKNYKLKEKMTQKGLNPYQV